MTTLDVHRLHADYHVPSVDVADRLDAVLGDVAGRGLSHELLDRPLTTAHAVCIPDVVVRVDLDIRAADTELTGAWCEAILDTVEERLRAGGDDARRAGAVVFLREVDLLVDVVRRVAAGDSSRLWAWRLAGAIPDHVAWPTRGDLVDLLVRRPQLLPAVLAGAGPALAGCLGDEVASWVALSRALAPLLGPTVDGRGAPDSATTTGAAARARSLIPVPVWRLLTGEADEPSVARLALVCVAPTLARDPAALSHVLEPREPTDDTHQGGGGDDAHDPTRGRDCGRSDEAVAHAGAGSSRSGGDPGTPGSAHDDDPPRSPNPSAAPRSGESPGAEPASVEAEVPPLASAHGGVLFLTHGITASDLVPSLHEGPLASQPVPEALARVVAAVSGAPVDDPAVLAVAGWRPDDPLDALSLPLDAARAAAVDEAAVALRSWLDERLGGRSNTAEDVDWVWRRRVELDVSPGWIEGTYRLDDVDLRLRVAGLDLDPGFVWWLGAVVGFRYV